MKYSNEIIINLPKQEMIKHLDNAENMKHWQKGLISYKILSEDPHAAGAKMELEYQMGKRNIKMVETIVESDFPDKFIATYETKGVWNLQENHFEEVSPTQSKWVSHSEFKFSGFMKLMSFFMPKSMFSKQSCQYLEDFKSFAESADTK